MISRQEVEWAESKEEEYWQKRMESGHYPCEACGQHSYDRICAQCQEADNQKEDEDETR
jgi:ribosomal protein L37E